MQARVVAIMVVFIVQIAFVGATSSNWKYEWEDKTATPLDQDTPTQTKQTNLHRADSVPVYHMKDRHYQLYQAIYRPQHTTSEQKKTCNNRQKPAYRLPQISYDQRPAYKPQAITSRPYYLPQNQHNLAISQQNKSNNRQKQTYRLRQISYDQRPANQPQTIPNRPYYQQTNQTNLDRADRVPKYHMKESHNQLYQAIYSNRSQDTTTSEQQNTFNNPQNPTYRLPQISYDQRPANQPQTITNIPYYLPQNQHNLTISQQNNSNNRQTHKSINPFSGQPHAQPDQIDPVATNSLFVLPFTKKQKVQSVYPHSPSNPGNNFEYKPTYFKINRKPNLEPPQGQLYDTQIEYITQEIRHAEKFLYRYKTLINDAMCRGIVKQEDLDRTAELCQTYTNMINQLKSRLRKYQY